jgi:hypothetical protein
MSKNREDDTVRRILQTTATGVPIVGQMLYVVCAKGHVNEASQHGLAQFRTRDGEVLQSPVCGRCQFDTIVATCGGELMPKGTTLKEAEWRARDLRRDMCAELGMPCCPKFSTAEPGKAHDGHCELPEDRTS